MTPAVAVVIATRDRAEFLERALASLASQTLQAPFETIVADNGSSDATREIVRRFAEHAPFDVEYVYEPEPNRGRARNRAVATARAGLIAFCDDDVKAPPGWLAAHVAAHAGGAARIVNGPILNVASYDSEPKATPANFSRASLCTCNASVPRASFESVGGFDESFDLYGWEDSELGMRLREAGVGWKFAWDAAIWHVKPPGYDTLDAQARKAVEKARMARRFLERHPSRRARMATGAHPLNLLRARLLPEWLPATLAGIAGDERTPAWLKAVARAQFLDAIYARELIRTLGATHPRSTS